MKTKTKSQIAILFPDILCDLSGFSVRPLRLSDLEQNATMNFKTNLLTANFPKGAPSSRRRSTENLCVLCGRSSSPLRFKIF